MGRIETSPPSDVGWGGGGATSEKSSLKSSNKRMKIHTVFLVSRSLCRAPSHRVKGSPFRVIKATAIDLFPHTMHCEMLFFFERIEYPNSKASSVPAGSAEIPDGRSVETPGVGSAEIPGVGSVETQGVRSAEIPDGRSVETPDVGSAEIPGVGSVETLGVKSMEIPDVKSPETTSLEADTTDSLPRTATGCPS